MSDKNLNIIKRNHTFLTGVYMATNAIKDLYLILQYYIKIRVLKPDVILSYTIKP